MDLQLADTPCIVTGASRGIGRAIAVALAGEGARVLLVARGRDALEDTRTRCLGHGGDAHPLALDVTGADAGERVLDACVERFGTPGVLVNNAGAGGRGALDDLTDEDWYGQWELHVMASMRLMRSIAPAMADAGGGRIVNVSSSAGKRPQVANAAYSVAKTAQLSLSRIYAEAYAARGVRVNAVAPGPTGTDLWHGPGGIIDKTAERDGISHDEALAELTAGLPTGRLATPEQIAAVVVMLCSPVSEAVTGSAWSADGAIVPTLM
jgi:3-oxoacyl-[acyl-carrier protein] reductase